MHNPPHPGEVLADTVLGAGGTATGPLIDRAPVMGTAILNAEPVSRV
jgi:hypothetical protein